MKHLKEKINGIKDMIDYDIRFDKVRAEFYKILIDHLTCNSNKFNVFIESADDGEWIGIDSRSNRYAFIIVKEEYWWRNNNITRFKLVALDNIDTASEYNLVTLELHKDGYKLDDFMTSKVDLYELLLEEYNK